MSYKRIALFGGTFDPVHCGHTTVAKDAAQRLNVDQLVFIPAKQSPLKKNAPQISDNDRVALIRLSLADQSLFTLNTCELTRPAPSYTLDTLCYLRKEYGSNVDFFWLMGADGVAELSHWYCIKELIKLCTLVTMVRSGCKHPDFNALIDFFGERTVKKFRAYVLQTPDVPISSTEIRKRIREGNDIRHLVHADVADYIKDHHLYQA